MATKKNKRTKAIDKRKFEVDEQKLAVDLRRILQAPPAPMKKSAKKKQAT
jgi:hypothetical protein